MIKNKNQERNHPHDVPKIHQESFCALIQGREVKNILKEMRKRPHDTPCC